MGVWIYQQRIAYRNGELTKGQMDLLNELEFDKFAEDKFEKRWEENLAIAKKYYDEHGTINVEHNMVYEGFNMGNWLTNAIADYHEGSLPQSRIEQLEELGVAWVRSGDDYNWNKYYNQLKNYLRSHDIDELTIEEDTLLYNWLEKQKYLIEQNQLEEDKLNKMVDLGISFRRKTKKNDNWDYNYNLAKEFYEKHGHLIVKKHYETENGEKLGYFLQGRRNAMKGVKGYKITQEEIDLLNEIGMVWGSLPEAEWHYNLKILKEYLDVTETPFPMSRGYIYKGVELGKLIFDIQTKIKGNKLSNQELSDVLAVLPDIQKVKLLTPKQEELIERRKKEEFLKAQELELKQKRLELQRQLENFSTLENIEIKEMDFANKSEMSISSLKWLENFESLRKYLVKNPTIPVDTEKLERYKKNLAGWLYQNINNYRIGKLREYQKNAFDSLDIDLQRLFPLTKEQNWLSYYDLFISFLDSDNIFSILKEYPDLQEWYCINLKKYQEDKLNVFTKEKFNKLMDMIDNN